MASINIHRVLPHEVVQTIGRTVADSLACQLSPQGLGRFSTALHSVAYCCDSGVTDPAAMPTTEHLHGASMADGIVPGEALVVFADAHPRRGYASATVWIHAIAEARDRGLCAAQRRARASTMARVVSRSVVDRPRNSADTRHRQLIELAAVVLDDAEIERLAAMSGCVPVVAIIGDTRSTGTTSGKIHRSTTMLPGRWLGTTPAAGLA